MSERPATITTECQEWAVQCFTRDGNLYTGRAFTSRREAKESGARLSRISGAEWWLVSRRALVTVETSAWDRDAQESA